MVSLRLIKQSLCVKRATVCIPEGSTTRDTNFWDFALHRVSLKVTNFCLFTGDVSPISMSPISQSQFIPLGEVLLLAISAMNSAHKPVTQEALTEHLQSCFPGKTSSHTNIIQ